MFAMFRTALSPLVLQAIATGAGILITRAVATAERRFGLDVEARHREALHSAILTGAQAALDAPSVEVAIDRVIAYAKQSVPGAILALAAPDGVLRKLAEAKLRMIAAHLFGDQSDELLAGLAGRPARS